MPRPRPVFPTGDFSIYSDKPPRKKRDNPERMFVCPTCDRVHQQITTSHWRGYIFHEGMPKLGLDKNLCPKCDPNKTELVEKLGENNEVKYVCA